MTFWSSQTLDSRLNELVRGKKPPKVDCNSIELTVGQEVYVTPNLIDVYTATKRQLGDNEPFQIPPGQFAFVLTEETVKVPTSAMAFISMKATFKMKGLINVSGFHVDPGWRGPLVFAVFNAGPAPVHLQRGLPLFLIWYANLDQDSKKHKSSNGPDTIPPMFISNLTGGNDTLHALDQRLKDGIKKLEGDDKALDSKLQDLRNTLTKNTVTITVLSTLLVGLIGFLVKENIPSLYGKKEHPISANDITPKPKAEVKILPQAPSTTEVNSTPKVEMNALPKASDPIGVD